MGAPVRIVRIRDGAFAFARALIVLPEEGEALGVRIGERAKEGGVGEAKDGGVRTDADGEHGNDQRGVTGISRCRLPSRTQIAPEH